MHAASRRDFMRAGASLAAGTIAASAWCSPVGWAAENAPDLDARDGRLFRQLLPLKSPRKKPPRQGGPLDRVELICWVPNGVESIRGVCANLFYVALAGRDDYQQLARHFGFALIGANYASVRNEDYDTFARALAMFAEDSGHPELAHAPFCFNGFSAGSGMLMKMAQRHPDRTIACAPVGLEVGPRDEATRAIPTITVFGERDGKQFEKLRAKVAEHRPQGARWAIAPQWGRRHEYHNANDLVWPLWEHAIRRRLSEPTPANAPPELAAVAEASGWLGEMPTKKGVVPRIAPYAEFGDERSTACWFQNAFLAHAWRAFLADVGQLRLETPGGLTLKNGAPLSVEVIKAPKNVAKYELFNGDTLIAESVGSATTLTAEGLPVGVPALYAVATTDDGARVYSKLQRRIVSDRL